MTTSEFKCIGVVWLTQLVRAEVRSRGHISNSKADFCNAYDLRASDLGQLAVLCCIKLVGGSSKRKQVCGLLLMLFFLLLQASCYFRRKSD